MAVEESMTIEETRHICLPSGTAAREDCALCGSRSIWSYYSKLDSIGVLNLASGDISDLRILNMRMTVRLRIIPGIPVQ